MAPLHCCISLPFPRVTLAASFQRCPHKLAAIPQKRAHRLSSGHTQPKTARGLICSLAAVEVLARVSDWQRPRPRRGGGTKGGWSEEHCRREPRVSAACRCRWHTRWVSRAQPEAGETLAEVDWARWVACWPAVLPNTWCGDACMMACWWRSGSGGRCGDAGLNRTRGVLPLQGWRHRLALPSCSCKLTHSR